MQCILKNILIKNELIDKFKQLIENFLKYNALNMI